MVGEDLKTKIRPNAVPARTRPRRVVTGPLSKGYADHNICSVYTSIPALVNSPAPSQFRFLEDVQIDLCSKQNDHRRPMQPHGDCNRRRDSFEQLIHLDFSKVIKVP